MFLVIITTTTTTTTTTTAATTTQLKIQRISILIFMMVGFDRVRQTASSTVHTIAASSRNSNSQNNSTDQRSITVQTVEDAGQISNKQQCEAAGAFRTYSRNTKLFEA
uniref:Uncharacterized protein n=1 Tax=Glossina pallidipes TaxID=7398 RepID=A0A1A9ZBN0_GLOPL